MSLVKQRIWDAGSETYCDGPDLIADTKAFKGYCCQQSILKTKKNRIRRPVPRHHRHLDDDGRFGFLARRRLRPTTGNSFAGFKRGGSVSSKLWLTTYPFRERANNRLLGETMLFHVHASAEAIEQPSETISWLSSWLSGSGVDPPEISPWRRPITYLEVAPASTAGHDIDDDDDDDDNRHQPNFVINQGPILRTDIDVLYLDKSFWRQYFAEYSPDQDIFIPGVYPKDLAQIQRVAVDVAVLRNRDEFAAVVRALRRHVPNMKIFHAVVTKIIPHAVVEPLGQVALLEDGLPDVFVSLEEKIRLGVHESADLVPAQGIVSANLSRLNVLGTSTTGSTVIQTRYMLLAYFDDAVQSVRGGIPDVDLPATQDGGESFSQAPNVPKTEVKTVSLLGVHATFASLPAGI